MTATVWFRATSALSINAARTIRSGGRRSFCPRGRPEMSNRPSRGSDSVGQTTDSVTDTEKQQGPLTGIKVLEVGHGLASPFCTMQLADMGADVIKIEEPVGGDMVRHNGPFVSGIASGFVRVNRNKRSLALNLK